MGDVTHILSAIEQGDPSEQVIAVFDDGLVLRAEQVG
jgi:hypothetical protein